MAGQPRPDPARFRAGWLTAGTVLTVLAITLGPLTAGLWLARQTETGHQTYPLSGTRVELALAGLDLRVLPGKEGELAVERQLTWSLARPELDERWDGRTLEVTAADCPPIPVGPQCDVDYTLRVPPGSAVTATIRSGDLTVSDMSGDLALSASDGDITIGVPRNTFYNLTIEATETDVNVPHHPAARHTITARTNTGTVRIQPTN